MEATPEDTASLNKLAQDCETRLRTIAQEEEAQQGATKPKDGTWASHQAIEFSLWCTKVGVHSEGRRSVDIRLKDVPEICDILRNLLQALRCDLEELQRPPEPIVQVEGDEHNAEDGDSDGSSLSFDSLTSSDDSRMRGSTDDVDKRKIKLRDHIEDTIDRLHGHERQIENSGAKHRQERVKLYCEKEGPSWAFNGYKELATRKANDEFKLASDTIKQRIAESFARRRIRFEYLERHQKKRAAVIVAPKPLPLAPQLAPADGSSIAIKKPIVPEKPSNTPMRRILQDQRTIYSATENTKLVMRPGSKLPERAESVASVALRHTGFPPPPRVTDGVFQCPYCRLEFRAREAEKARWIQHVMQDFEPYFCIAEDCKTPFDVPNSFNGLLGHLQEHLPLTWHADLPGGETKEFDDEGLFTNYVIEHGGVSGDALTILKETSLRRTAFLFVTCPFCGGYPDVLEKNHPDPAQPEAQLALRRHIKQHMHDIALFLPPYRDDILEDCGDFNSSAVTRRRSIDANNSSESSKQPTICDNEDCDCKDWEKDFTDHDLISQDPPVDIDFWPTLLRDSGLYDRSAGLDEDWEFDTCLKPFVTRFLDKPDDLNDAYLSTTSELPKFTVVSLEEEHDETGPMTTESIAHLLPLSFFRSPPVSAIRPPETYTIAWVCSLRDSFTAAKMFLDEEHRNNHPEERNSDNPQTMGRIGRHNVVIIFWNSLLGIRTQDITDMFPNVQIRLVVDIAGGVPSTKHDIRLGDVVVSGGEDPDMKGLLHCADYRTRASMTLPSDFLEELLPGLEHALTMSRQQCEAVIRAVLKGNLQDEENFGHPHPESDVLYKPDVVHYRVDGQPCIEKHGDDASQIISRGDSAIDQNSAVHYGLVAFGHLLRQGVRRDRKLRDQIIDNNPVLCIERVTSFVEGEFPDLVIHGICDYSDGHQYPEWEGYAAMAAATYASNLIRRLPALPTEEEEHTVASNETPAGQKLSGSKSHNARSISSIVRRLSLADDEPEFEFGQSSTGQPKAKQPGTSPNAEVVPQLSSTSDGLLSPHSTASPGSPRMDRNTQADLFSPILVFDDRGSLLLLKRTANVGEPDLWEPPGWDTEYPDANSYQFCLRKLQEQTGLNPRHIKRFIFGRMDGAPGATFSEQTAEDLPEYFFEVDIKDGRSVRLDSSKHGDFAWAANEVGLNNVENIPLAHPHMLHTLRRAFDMRQLSNIHASAMKTNLEAVDGDSVVNLTSEGAQTTKPNFEDVDSDSENNDQQQNQHQSRGQPQGYVDDDETENPSRVDAAGVGDTAGTELPEPSPSIASPSSSSDKPASQFSDTNLPYGFLADDMRSFELLRTGTLEDRASAADSLRSSIPVSSDHSFLIDIWNAAKDLVDPGQPARARIAAWNLLTQIILVSHPGPGRLAFLTTFHSPTHPDDFQLQISAVACLTHGGRRLTEVEYISLLPILVEWMQHAYAPVPPTPRRPGSPERSQHLTARRGTARRKGNLAQIFDILLDAISPAFVNSNLAAGLSLADALLKICRTTTSEDNLKQSLRLIDILLTSQIILKFVFENCVVVIYDLYCKSGKHRPVYNRLWRTLSILLKSDHGPQIVNTLVDFLKQAPIESTNVRYINRGLRSILSVLQRLVSSDIDKGYPSVQYALLVDGLSTVATTRSYLPNLAAVLELINALFDDGQHNLHPLLLDEDWALILDVAWKCGGGTSEDPDPESPGSLCSNLVTLIKRLDFLVSQDGDFKQRETAVEFLTKVNLPVRHIYVEEEFLESFETRKAHGFQLKTEAAEGAEATAVDNVVESPMQYPVEDPPADDPSANDHPAGSGTALEYKEIYVGTAPTSHNFGSEAAVAEATNTESIEEQLPTPHSATKSHKCFTAVIKREFEGTLENELHLSEGQYVTNIEKMSDIWWYGTNAEGFHGLFPSNHVEVVDDSAAEHQLSQMPPTTAIVTFDYDRADDNEIDLREGERIEDIDRVDKLWWLGTNEKGQRGVFPSNYVELVKDSDRRSQMSKGSRLTVSVQSDYQSTDSDQIDLVAGELLTNIRMVTDNWWMGTNKKGERGLFPKDLTQVVMEERSTGS